MYAAPYNSYMEAVDEEAWSLQSTRADSVHPLVAPAKKRTLIPDITISVPIFYVSAR